MGDPTLVGDPILVIQFWQADEDDNGINDVFDEVIEKYKQPADSAEYRLIEPLRGPFVGSWMAWDTRYQGLTNAELLDRQRFVPQLYESR